MKKKGRIRDAARKICGQPENKQAETKRGEVMQFYPFAQWCQKTVIFLMVMMRSYLKYCAELLHQYITNLKSKVISDTWRSDILKCTGIWKAENVMQECLSSVMINAVDTVTDNLKHWHFSCSVDPEMARCARMPFFQFSSNSTFTSCPLRKTTTWVGWG